MSIILRYNARYSRPNGDSFKPSSAHQRYTFLRCLSTRRAPAWTTQSIIFSGIQPTGVPHLGNYLGALRAWKTLQDVSSTKTALFFSIVDLHALTVPENAGSLPQFTKETVAALIAVGLDPERCTIFRQSDVRQIEEQSHSRLMPCLQVCAHSELMWILSTIAWTGRLSKMTQWKVKTISLNMS